MNKVIINFSGNNKSVGTCGVSYDEKVGVAVMVDLDGDQGTSVVNATEVIAPIVAETLMKLPLGKFRLFDSSQSRIKDGVDFDASEVFIHDQVPDWRPLSDADRELLKPYLKRWELRNPRLI